MSTSPEAVTETMVANTLKTLAKRGTPAADRIARQLEHTHAVANEMFRLDEERFARMNTTALE